MRRRSHRCSTYRRCRAALMALFAFGLATAACSDSSSGGSERAGEPCRTEKLDSEGEVRMTTRTSFDDEGRVLEQSMDFRGDEAPERVLNHEYRDGLLVESVWDEGPDDEPDFVIENRHDDAGNLVRKNKDSDVDGAPDRFIAYEYDDAGRRVKERWYFDPDADEPDAVYVHHWDCDG